MTLAQHEYAANYTTRAVQLLDATPENLRHWEYKYLMKQCHEELRDFAGFSVPSLSLAVSHNKNWVAAASTIWGTNQECEIRVWDIAQGSLRFVLQGHPSSIMDVQFSPDDKYLASCGIIWQSRQSPGGKVKLWDAETGSEIAELTDEHVAKIAFNPDGKTIAIGRVSGEVQIRRLPTGELEKTLSGHSQMILDLSYDPTGTFLASASRDGSCRIWNVSNGDVEYVVDGLGDIRSVDFSPNKAEFALCTFGGAIKVFERGAEQFREVASYAEANRVARVRYSPDAKCLAVAVLGEGVALIDPRNGRLLRRFPGHNGDPQAVAFSGDGQLLATSGIDGHVKIWDVTRPVEPIGINRVGPFFVDVEPVPNRRWMAVAKDSTRVAD